MKKLFQFLAVMITLSLCALGCGKQPVKLTDTQDQIQGLENYSPSGELSKTFNESITYEVKDIDWSKDTGVAQVEVTTPDLNKIMLESIEQALSQPSGTDYETLLNTVHAHMQILLSTDAYSTVQTNITMDVQKQGDGYVLISNDAFLDAISGNLEQALLTLLVEDQTND